MSFKILGREPAVIVGVLNPIILLVGTFGLKFISPDQALLWVAAVNATSAAVVAWTTRPLTPGPIAYLISALLAVGASYGFELSPETTVAINAMVVPILAFLTRDQVTPQLTKITSTTEAAGKPEVQTVAEG